MMRSPAFIAALNAGEWSADLHRRADLPKYKLAAKVAFNVIAKPHGPVMRRPGSRLIGRTLNDAPARLMEFVYNAEQAYGLEFTAGALRIIRDGGFVAATQAPPAIVNGGFNTDISGWSASSASWNAEGSAQVSGSINQGITAPPLTRLHLRFRIRGTAGTNWLNVRAGSAALGTDLLADTRCDVGWHVIPYTTPAGGNHFISFVAGGGARVDDVAFCAETVQLGTPYGEARLWACQGAQQADVLYLADEATAPHRLERLDHDRWRLIEVVFTAKPAEWAGTSWPRAITFFEQRLWLGGTRDKSQTLWASKTDAYTDFTIGTTDEAAMKYTIADNRGNAIRALSAGKYLAVFTSDAEFGVSASSLGEAITPTNISIKRETTTGIPAGVAPVRVNSAVLFPSRTARRLHEFAYSLQEDAFAAPDLTLLARHVTRAGIRQLAWAPEPHAQVWVALQNGGLAALTYMRDQDVVGWARHDVGGKVLSVASVPEAGRDAVYLVVERALSDQLTVRTVERIEPDFEVGVAGALAGSAGPALDAAFFVDGGASLAGPASQAPLLVGGDPLTIGGEVSIAPADPAAYGALHAELANREGQRLIAWGGDGTGALRRGVITVTTIGAPGSGAERLLGTVIRPMPSRIEAGGWRWQVTTVAGLAHLEGQMVAVLADGASHPMCRVQGGGITLARPAGWVSAGLPYRSEWESLDIELASQGAGSAGRRQRIVDVTAAFVETLGAFVSSGSGQAEEVLFRSAGDPLDAAAPLFTGVKRLPLPGGYSDPNKGQVSVRVESDQPLPFTLAAVTATVSQGDL